MRKITTFFCTLLAAVAIGPQTNADIVIDVIETGGNVQATLSGNLDLNATQGYVANSGGSATYRAVSGNIGFSSKAHELYGMNVDWTPFGPGEVGHWDSSSGDNFAMFGVPYVGVPLGYVSGTNLSASATKNGSSFAALGFTPGSYVTTLTNGNFSSSVTVNIGQSVPEPASTGLIGMFGLAVVTRRRKR